jgi:hypothetical protein
MQNLLRKLASLSIHPIYFRINQATSYIECVSLPGLGKKVLPMYYAYRKTHVRWQDLGKI